MIGKLIENFKNIKIAVIGDLMLDEYIMGKVDRISPEAPVPVVKVTEEKYLYFVIRKKPKIRNYYITGILKTRKDYQGKSLNKIIKRIINTGKKNLK